MERGGTSGARSSQANSTTVCVRRKPLSSSNFRIQASVHRAAIWYTSCAFNARQASSQSGFQMPFQPSLVGRGQALSQATPGGSGTSQRRHQTPFLFGYQKRRISQPVKRTFPIQMAVDERAQNGTDCLMTTDPFPVPDAPGQHYAYVEKGSYSQAVLRILKKVDERGLYITLSSTFFRTFYSE